MNHQENLSFALLAAGKGTRMNSEMPKVLTEILGKKLIDYSLTNLLLFGKKVQASIHINIVIGYKKELVRRYVEEHYIDEIRAGLISFSVQEEQNGTADALRAYFKGHQGALDYKYTGVMCADMPLIEEAVVSKIYHHLSSKKNLEGVAATFETERPEGLGRIKRSDKGFAIIEHKDCSSSELLIKEANSGFYILDTEFVKNNLDSISNQNKSNEFYLTDLFTPEQDVFAFCFKTDDYFLGVNNQFQKQAVLRRLKERKNKSLIKKGVMIDLPEQVYIEWDVEIGAGTQISPNTFIYGKTTIDEGVVIEPGVIIKNSQIASGSTIFGNSYLEEASVGRSSKIGPMARLRPGTEIGDECKIGNFVEVKKAVFERGAQASHLSYIGDARIGEGTNLGCGFITCNYDGKNKHRTEIGKNCFIGSDCQMIAPVIIGDDCFIAAGSTVTQSLDSGDFAIARTRQVTKQGMANKFIKSKD